MNKQAETNQKKEEETKVKLRLGFLEIKQNKIMILS